VQIAGKGVAGSINDEVISFIKAGRARTYLLEALGISSNEFVLSNRRLWSLWMMGISKRVK
jgi:hypothetical protein